MHYMFKTIPSPVGVLKLIASDQGLAGIFWENTVLPFSSLMEDSKHPVLQETEKQLLEYFSGKRKEFSIKLDLQGTVFQRKVWDGLLTIPYGETRSYGALAVQIGHPRAFRAVGAAAGQNPVSIIVPCHRLIGSNGKLTGFAGGLDVKEWLLKLEGGDF